MPKVLFSSTNQPASRGNNGRKPKIATVPKDARQRVFGALYHALSLPDKAAADKYLQEQGALPEFGYLIQVYAKGLMGKNGWEVAEAIIDRLFGKPKQATDVNIGAQDRTTFQITVGSPEAAAGLRKALDTGAQPAPPEDPAEED